ncbi:MAG: phosphatase PAP2 family protein [Alloprevotella sp.]|nr:phosphatase PAP2 family protein [Alloprevotella sp.]
MNQLKYKILASYNAPERLTLAYAAFTAVLTLALWSRLDEPVCLLLQRVGIVLLVCALNAVWQRFPRQDLRVLRTIVPLALLAFWYPDTFEFCSTFPNQDHIFARCDYALFGCQPALVFSTALSGQFWSEAFHLGYFSYYPIILTACLVALCRKPNRGLDHWTPVSLESRPIERFEWVCGVVLASFFLYYLVFLFLPVAGPQYYFEAIGRDAASMGNYPELGHYFRGHAELSADADQLPRGVFQILVDLTQRAGERPTAAFPSSHVGVSTIVLWLLFRLRRNWALALLPLWVLLCFSTVYLQAHYFIDAITGLLTAPIFLIAARWLTNRLTPSTSI